MVAIVVLAAAGLVVLIISTHIVFSTGCQIMPKEPIKGGNRQWTPVISKPLSPITDLISFQRTLVGLCRDIRGLAFAFNSKNSYMMLFEWMYPYQNDSKKH